MNAATALFACSSVFLLLSSCNLEGESARRDPRILVCEHIVLAHQRSPSTYRTLDESIVESTVPIVQIQYESANAFGTPVRGRAICDFTQYKRDGINNIDSVIINGREVGHQRMVILELEARLELRESDQ